MDKRITASGVVIPGVLMETLTEDSYIASEFKTGANEDPVFEEYGMFTVLSSASCVVLPPEEFNRLDFDRQHVNNVASALGVPPYALNAEEWRAELRTLATTLPGGECVCSYCGAAEQNETLPDEWTYLINTVDTDDIHHFCSVRCKDTWLREEADIDRNW